LTAANELIILGAGLHDQVLKNANSGGTVHKGVLGGFQGRIVIHITGAEDVAIDALGIAWGRIIAHGRWWQRGIARNKGSLAKSTA
jgi:hypothetical protein